jgi:small conductance mechanosensitive channel
MNQQLEDTVHTALPLLTSYGMSVVGALVILILGWIVAGIAYRMSLKAVLKSDRIDETIGRFIAEVLRYAILIFTVIAVLAKFGVQTASIIAVLGALGLAVGFALQGTLSNVAAGLLFLFLRPFKIGDFIEAGGASGTVAAVNLFSTELNTPDNVLTIVPNAAIISSTIKNYTANPKRRVDLVMGIAYEDDINKAFGIMKHIIEADSRIATEPAPFLVVGELADSSVNLIVRVWCDRDNYWPVKFDLTKAFKEAFDAQGVTIPFPQRVVHYADKAAAE